MQNVTLKKVNLCFITAYTYSYWTESTFVQ